MQTATTFTHAGWRPAPDRFLAILDSPLHRAIAELQNLVTVVSTQFWAERGVRAMHLPITTDTISSPMGLGSDSLPVQVDLFGRPTYLADSMQFMLEYGCRLSPSGAWYLMPSFRGEDSDSTHLNQFFHSEAELPGGLDEVMHTVEAYVRALSAAVLDQHAEEVLHNAGDTGHLEHMAALEEFPRITFDEAVRVLGDDPASVRHEGGWRTLTRHGELRLMAEVAPVLWVTHYDHLSVPFYQAYEDESRSRARNADLLFGIGEVVGAGERHIDATAARGALRHHGVDAASYDWYLRMKQARPMLTSGFGLGVERWLMWVLGQSDIREMQLAPRLNGISLAP
ncbi:MULTISPECIES: amino acid--tRNA ligase-related protein [unclassified Streptomyces]|uniref:amino acid--tRNA ligase-related protein n=1 Tax=unclassified Streptomyces TaxID=2593676 RepID=UPI003812D595